MNTGGKKNLRQSVLNLKLKKKELAAAATGNRDS